jgi:hypothetical protein
MIAAMETDSYWRTRCVGEAMDQGYTFLRLTCNCGRITDFPIPPAAPAQRRQPGHLHRQHRFSLPEVRKHIAACGGQFSKPDDAVSRDPGSPVKKPGSRTGRHGAWGRRKCRLAHQQFLGSRRVPRLMRRLFPLDSASRFARFPDRPDRCRANPDPNPARAEADP